MIGIKGVVCNSNATEGSYRTHTVHVTTNPSGNISVGEAGYGVYAYANTDTGKLEMMYPDFSPHKISCTRAEIQNATEIVGFIYNDKKFMIDEFRPPQLIVCCDDDDLPPVADKYVLLVIGGGKQPYMKNYVLFCKTGTYTFFIK